MPYDQDYLGALAQQVSQNPDTSFIAPQPPMIDPYAAQASGDTELGPAYTSGGSAGRAQRLSDPFLTAQVALAQIPLRPARRRTQRPPPRYRSPSSYTLSALLGGYS